MMIYIYFLCNIYFYYKPLYILLLSLCLFIYVHIYAIFIKILLYKLISRREKSMKKSFIRKGLAALLSAVMLIGLLPADNTSTVYASTELSETISSNQTITKTVSGGTNYTFNYTMPDSGYFYVTFTPVKSVKASTGKESYWESMGFTLTANYKTYSTFSGKRAKDGTQQTSEFTFAPGTNVSLRVTTSSYDYNYNLTYTVTVHYCTTKYQEKETNNTKKKASTLKLKKTYYGNLPLQDTDWYVFKAPKAGKYTFRVTNADLYRSTYSNSYFYANAFKGTKRLCSSDKTAYSNSGAVKLTSVKLKKGQKVYVRLTSSNKYNVNYRIKVTKK